jgi:glutamate synthase (NADPH/NADH) large chain
MEINLRGYANDYVCKGMAGGKVIVSPPTADDESVKKSGRGSSAAKSSVVGNTVLYGATGGSLFVRGRGGERFAVRNSGALGVVEGLGDHGCEYMTAGNIICIGNTGRNFAAGMTGGIAFVIDDEDWLDGGVGGVPEHVQFPKMVNTESVTVNRLSKENK